MYECVCVYVCSVPDASYSIRIPTYLISKQYIILILFPMYCYLQMGPSKLDFQIEILEIYIMILWPIMKHDYFCKYK